MLVDDRVAKESSRKTAGVDAEASISQDGDTDTKALDDIFEVAGQVGDASILCKQKRVLKDTKRVKRNTRG